MPSLVYRAPAPVTEVRGRAVFLGGTIERCAEPWQEKVAQRLAHLPVTVFDSRRADWDASGAERGNRLRTKEQADWELDQQKRADVVAVYFHPKTQAPVSLLEFGLAAARAPGKVVVCCPDGFPKKGNVEMVCERLGVPMVESFDELVERIAQKVQQ